MAQTVAGPGIKSRATVLAKVLATQGPAWALQRVSVSLRKKLRIAELTTPVADWETRSLQSMLRPGIPSDPEAYGEWREANGPLFFSGKSLGSQMGKFFGERVLRDADQVLEGVFPFFGYPRTLGFPPQWQTHPDTGAAMAQGHWSQLDEFANGDVKLCWEPNRFSWVFTLGRAYVRTHDEKYAEAFWILLENWRGGNPPNFGVNWICGQEVALRALALCFAWYAFAEATSTTSGRRVMLLRVIWMHASRVNAFIGYAISQKNNHTISEASCLWSVGLLFPELRMAQVWRERGRKLLENAASEQIYSDGAYIQHSANYHRVMLQELAWSLRLGELCQPRLSEDLYRKVAVATSFLHSITDEISGCAPNYGHNDGALIFPFTDCAYSDMRPVLQVCNWITRSTRLYPPGPWDEETVWLCGETATESGVEFPPVARKELDAPEGGCYTVLGDESWAMLRASRYRDRPAQADQLHLDLWWRGSDILCDPGTYSYNAPAPFADAFASTRRHNTVTIDGLDQMTRLSRFFWADWAQADARRAETPISRLSVLHASHDGYARCGVLHSRSVAYAGDGVWIIVDDLSGEGSHTATLHWLLPDGELMLFAGSAVAFNLPCGPVHLGFFTEVAYSLDVVRAGERIAATDGVASVDFGRGWNARCYARRDPALSVQLSCLFQTPLRLVTIVSLGAFAQIEASCDSVRIGHRTVPLAAIGVAPRSHDPCAPGK